MKTIYVITLILIIIMIVLGLLIFIYKDAKHKLESIYKRLEDTEKDYDDKFKIKYDLVVKYIKAIKDKYKIESKTFDSVTELGDEFEYSLKNENLINKCYKELNKIKEEKQKIKELKAFREIINDYEENELSLLSLRTYYNTHIVSYNNIIKHFPYNIISKFKKYKVKSLLEGKEIESDFNNNLDV